MNLQNRKSRRPIPTLLSCALASCLALAAPAAMAQSTASTLRGVVTADAAPVANATIVATNLANGFTARATANADGSYALFGLQPGTYRIDVTANGKTGSQTVTLAIGQTASLNLPVGGAAAMAANQRTTIRGDPAETAPIDAASAKPSARKMASTSSTAALGATGRSAGPS
mgnify:CR=1 FL=1